MADPTLHFTFHSVLAQESALSDAVNGAYERIRRYKESIWSSRAWLKQDLKRSISAKFRRLTGRTSPDEQSLIAMIDTEVRTARDKITAIKTHREELVAVSKQLTKLVISRNPLDPVSGDDRQAIAKICAPLGGHLKEAYDALTVINQDFSTRHTTHQMVLSNNAEYQNLPLDFRQILQGDTDLSAFGSALQMFGQLHPTSEVHPRGQDEPVIFLAQFLTYAAPGEKAFYPVIMIENADFIAQNWSEVWCESGWY